MVRLCIECRHLSIDKDGKPTLFNGDYQCCHPKNNWFDPVRGGLKAWSPSWLRSPTHTAACGPEAKWFEERRHG
jgi:hypothetical protein